MLLKFSAILVVFLLFLSKIKDVYCKIAPPQKGDSLNKCLEKIIDRHFIKTGVIISNTSIDLPLKNSKLPQILISQNQLEVLDYPAEVWNYIIEIENLEGLNKTLSFLNSTENFNARAKYVIVSRDCDNVDYVASVLWYFNLYKSVIVLDDGKKDVTLYTLNMKDSNCGKNVAAQKFAKCGDRRLDLGKIFPINVEKDFKNCEIVVLWSSCPPWVINPNEINPGIFISVVKAMGMYVMHRKYKITLMNL